MKRDMKYSDSLKDTVSGDVYLGKIPFKPLPMKPENHLDNPIVIVLGAVVVAMLVVLGTVLLVLS
jgi:hypothetical protein